MVCSSYGPTVVALRPGPAPVPPPPLRRVGVALNHRGDEASVADWERGEGGSVKGRSPARGAFKERRTH